MILSLRPTGDMFLKLSHVMYDVEQEKINAMTGALELNQMVGTASYHEQRLMMGIARL